MEPQYRRDHLQLNSHMLGFTQNTGYAILCILKTKGKYNRWTRRHMPKTMKLTGNTSAAALCGERGHIFINERTGKRLTLQHFEKIIDKWARLLNIQKLQSIKPSGREYHLITLMGLRVAGERHYDPNGGDPDVSAKAAGHSKETKAKYYKKVSYEEAQESFGRHHPAFVEGGETILLFHIFSSTFNFISTIYLLDFT